MEKIEDLRDALSNAAKVGQVETVSEILAQFEVNAETLNTKDNTGYTPLMWAVDQGYIEVVKVLLDHRNDNGKPLIDLNEKDNDNRTALILASMLGHGEIVNTILAQLEANTEALNAKDNTGFTALIWAVNQSNVEVVRALLAHRDGDGEPLIDVNEKDNQGRTALMMASMLRHGDISRLILVHQLSRNPWTALQRSSLFNGLSRNEVGSFARDFTRSFILALVVAAVITTPRAYY